MKIKGLIAACAAVVLSFTATAQSGGPVVLLQSSGSFVRNQEKCSLDFGFSGTKAEVAAMQEEAAKYSDYLELTVTCASPGEPCNCRMVLNGDYDATYATKMLIAFGAVEVRHNGTAYPIDQAPAVIETLR